MPACLTHHTSPIPAPAATAPTTSGAAQEYARTHLETELHAFAYDDSSAEQDTTNLLVGHLLGPTHYSSCGSPGGSSDDGLDFIASLIGMSAHDDIQS